MTSTPRQDRAWLLATTKAVAERLEVRCDRKRLRTHPKSRHDHEH